MHAIHLVVGCLFAAVSAFLFVFTVCSHERMGGDTMAGCAVMAVICAGCSALYLFNV